jgi:hypothetical protein
VLVARGVFLLSPRPRVPSSLTLPQGLPANERQHLLPVAEGLDILSSLLPTRCCLPVYAVPAATLFALYRAHFVLRSYSAHHGSWAQAAFSGQYVIRSAAFAERPYAYPMLQAVRDPRSTKVEPMMRPPRRTRRWWTRSKAAVRICAHNCSQRTRGGLLTGTV